jgi:lysozyme family protein
MADLSKALPGLLAIEGGYVNDPLDQGQETYCGISRRYHPSWGGWPIIDAMRKHGPINHGLLRGPGGLVEAFYRAQLWDRFQGDQIPDQVLADEILDQAVNLGVHRAISHLQRALNALNNQQARWPDLLRDGECGPQTIAAIEAAQGHGLIPHLLTAIKAQQGCYYLERMEARPVNEKYTGWFARV